MCSCGVVSGGIELSVVVVGQRIRGGSVVQSLGEFSGSLQDLLSWKTIWISGILWKELLEALESILDSWLCHGYIREAEWVASGESL